MIQVLDTLTVDISDIGDPRIETRAINISSSTATFRCAVPKTKMVQGYEEGGGGRIVRKMTQVQEEERFSIPPGAIIDAQGYARARVHAPDNFEVVPTVVEGKTRGAVVPIWHSKARKFLQRVAEEQALARHRDHVISEALSGVEEGLRDRGVPSGLHVGLMMDRIDRMRGDGRLFVSTEDNVTILVQDGAARKPLGQWLDEVALELMDTSVPAKKPKAAARQVEADGVQRDRA